MHDLLIVGAFTVAAGLLAYAVVRVLRWHATDLAPTQPDEPDDEEREESGADEEYAADLHRDAAHEDELAAIAEEHGLDLLDPDDRELAQGFHDLRRAVAEDIDHFSARIGALIDDWAPGWYREPTVVLPTFAAVHALVDDTQSFAAVTG